MRRTSGLGIVLGLILSVPAWAGEPGALRVCADPNNLPLSSKNRDGLENKIAELWAQELNVPVEYTWFPQRRGFLRKTLKAVDESNGGFKCDLVMGVAAGYDRLLTTKPYYRSTYALVYAKGRGLDDVASSEDFLGLNADVKKKLKIGAFTPTPGTKWLARHDLFEQMVAFPAMSGDPSEYPGEIVEKNLVEGALDVVVVWGPMAGFFANRVSKVELVVIPLQSEPGIRFDFSIAAGVRYGDGARKDQIEAVMGKTAPQMQAILTQFKVPLLDLAADKD